MTYDRLTLLTHPKAEILKAKYAHRSDWMKAWNEIEFGLNNLVKKKMFSPSNVGKKCERERLLGSKVKTECKSKQTSPSTTIRRRSPRLMERSQPHAPNTATNRRSSRIKEQKKQ